MDSQGIISGVTVANAAIDERDVIQKMTEGIGGLCAGIKAISVHDLPKNWLKKVSFYRQLHEKQAKFTS
jgi:hypothetical protein